MEKELKEYLRQFHKMTEADIARIEETATEEQLEVLRKGMRSMLELTGGRTLEQMEQDLQQEQEAARERVLKAARREAREERTRRKNGFALGLGFPFFVGLFFMLLKWILG